MKENNEKVSITEKLLKDDSKLSVDKLLKKYHTSLEGVSIVDVEDRLFKYGNNIIDIKNNNTIWNRLKEAFINPFNVVLMIVAIITFFTDVMIATKKDYATFILIVSIILISAFISFLFLRRFKSWIFFHHIFPSLNSITNTLNYRSHFIYWDPYLFHCINFS